MMSFTGVYAMCNSRMRRNVLEYWQQLIPFGIKELELRPQMSEADLVEDYLDEFRTIHLDRAAAQILAEEVLRRRRASNPTEGLPLWSR